MDRDDSANKALQPLRVPRSTISDAALHASWISMEMVLVPHPTEGFVAACTKKEREDESVVEIVETGETLTVKKEHIFQMNAPKYDKVEDMAKLTHYNEAAILYNIKRRYYEKLIYVSTYFYLPDICFN